mgnify:CR=1 FL=1
MEYPIPNLVEKFSAKNNMAKETPNDTRKEVNIEGNIAGNTQWRMRPHFLKPKA